MLESLLVAVAIPGIVEASTTVTTDGTGTAVSDAEVAFPLPLLLVAFADASMLSFPSCSLRFFLLEVEVDAVADALFLSLAEVVAGALLPADTFFFPAKISSISLAVAFAFPFTSPEDAAVVDVLATPALLDDDFAAEPALEVEGTFEVPATVVFATPFP